MTETQEKSQIISERKPLRELRTQGPGRLTLEGELVSPHFVGLEVIGDVVLEALRSGTYSPGFPKARADFYLITQACAPNGISWNGSVPRPIDVNVVAYFAKELQYEQD